MDFSGQASSQPPAAESGLQDVSQHEVRAWTMFLDLSEAQLVEAVRPAVATGRRLTVQAWPNGAKAAVAITFDVDNEFPMTAALPAQVGGGSYGWFQALPRIHRFLDEEEVPASFYIPVGSALIAPQMVPDILKSGRNEIGLHGWTHERIPSLMELMKNGGCWSSRSSGTSEMSEAYREATARQTAPSASIPRTCSWKRELSMTAVFRVAMIVTSCLGEGSRLALWKCHSAGY